MILHWHVGKRNSDDALEFLQGLRARVRGHFQLTSDGFNAYAGAQGGVWRTFRNSIDYAFEVKHFSSDPHAYGLPDVRRQFPVKCQWVKRTAQIGKPDLGIATINHAERTNLSVRLFNRRFTRKTLGYSKKLANHKHSIALMVAHFDFCRLHSSLPKQTPAMAQGLTDHAWTIKELLACPI